MPTPLPRDRTVSFAEYSQWFAQNNGGQQPTRQDYDTYLQLRGEPVQVPTPQIPNVPSQGADFGRTARQGMQPIPRTQFQQGPQPVFPDFGGINLGGGDPRNDGGFVDWAKRTIGAAWDFIKDNPEVLAAAYAAYRSSQDRGRQQGFQDEAIGLSRERWEEGAPLRARATEMLMSPIGSGPDLSATFADPGNPYYKGPLPATGGGGASGAPDTRYEPAPPGSRTNDPNLLQNLYNPLPATNTGPTGYIPAPNAVPTRRAMPRILPATRY